MLTIFKEVTIDLGEEFETDPLTLWLVAHGQVSESDLLDRWSYLLDLLRKVVDDQGGYIESNDDPLCEQQLGLPF